MTTNKKVVITEFGDESKLAIVGGDTKQGGFEFALQRRACRILAANAGAAFKFRYATHSPPRPLL